MGNLHFGAPPALLLELKQLSGARMFIETGTYLGDTTLLASDLFRAVVSVENSPQYFEQAQEACLDRPNIFLILGDSKDELPEIARAIKQPVIVWLDAHMMRGSKSKPGDSPVLEELEALQPAKHNVYVMIDDASIYASGRTGWPSLDEVKDKLGETHNVSVVEDVIVGIPRNGATPCMT